MPIGAMGAALALVVRHLSRHTTSPKASSPCEAIFQPDVARFVDAYQLLENGRRCRSAASSSPIDERAQMAALNLKTCCTVLDAGRLDPEQFLQCRATRALMSCGWRT
jgi:hypothetical protein